jgi:hypothetical protein
MTGGVGDGGSEPGQTGWQKMTGVVTIWSGNVLLAASAASRYVLTAVAQAGRFRNETVTVGTIV